MYKKPLATPVVPYRYKTDRDINDFCGDMLISSGEIDCFNKLSSFQKNLNSEGSEVEADISEKVDNVKEYLANQILAELNKYNLTSRGGKSIKSNKNKKQKTKRRMSNKYIKIF